MSSDQDKKVHPIWDYLKCDNAGNFKICKVQTKAAKLADGLER